MKLKSITIAALAAALFFSISSFSFASGRGGGNCKDCPMANITAEQRANIRGQLNALKDSGATGEEIKAFKAEVLNQYGVQMREGQHNRGRLRGKRK